MFIEFRGHHVHAVSWGSGEPVIVGISGAFGTWEIWEPPFELLSKRHRVIAYDHLGAGATHVPRAEVTFDNQVALVEAILDAFGVESCVLAGDSNMVAVAVEAAVRWPERIEALALVAGSVGHTGDPVVRRFVHGLRHDLDRTLDNFVARCIPEPGSPHLRSWLRGIILRTGGERAATLLESFYGIDVSARLGELRQPTTVIHGEADALPTSSAAAAQALANAIPGGHLDLLPGVGHVPTLTRPEAVAACIESLARVSYERVLRGVRTDDHEEAE